MTRRHGILGLTIVLVAGCGAPVNPSPVGVHATPISSTTPIPVATQPSASTAATSMSTPTFVGVPIASGGWSWRPGDGSVVSHMMSVANGLIGYCEPEPSEYVVCSSLDGLDWTTPADPAIFVGPPGFAADRVVRGSGRWFAYASGASTVARRGAPIRVWDSVDGVTWAAADLPDLHVPEPLWSIAFVGGRYLAAGSDFDGKTAAMWFESDAGEDWRAAEGVPDGIFLDFSNSVVGLRGYDATGAFWYSADGRAWVACDLPPGIDAMFGPVARAPNGHLLTVGIKSYADILDPAFVLDSADGKTWIAAEPSPVARPFQFAVVGDTTFLIAGPDFTLSSELWLSPDSGATWREILRAPYRFGVYVLATPDRLVLTMDDRSGSLLSLGGTTVVGVPS